MKKKKLFQKILSGSPNIRFEDVVAVVEAFGFHFSRMNGSHHIYCHPKVPELVNLQNKKGKAKAYQIRQFLALVEQYSLPMED